MKFITASLSFMYVGVVYFAHAEKRNIRGLAEQIATEPETSTTEVTTATTVTADDDEEVYYIEPEFEGDVEMGDEYEGESEGEGHYFETTLEEPDPPASRKLGTVTNFDIIGKGATTPVVAQPVLVYEKEASHSGPSYSGPSKGRGRRYYGGSYGKGKGGRYGYYGGGSYGYGGYGKGKGGRYYYGGHHRGRYGSSPSSDDGGQYYKAAGYGVGGTTVAVKEVVEVGKGAW